MARIRTIKPEFWTDEKIVSLPFEARLLFIGLWNFCDDSGCLDYSPDRITMQIFPGNPEIDVSGMLDLLSILGLLEFMVDTEGGKAIRVVNWSIHQKIDNPSRKSVVSENYRKLAIPSEVRLVVARRHECKPGLAVQAECFYCGSPGKVHWHIGSRGKPTKWIYLSDLEFDHFVSELRGGENNQNNLVLACRSCNRAKREFSPLQFFVQKNIQGAFDIPIEPSPLDQGSRIKEGKGMDQGSEDLSVPQRTAELVASLPKVQLVTPATRIFDHWKSTHGHPRARLDSKRIKLINAALKLYDEATLCQSISGYLNSPHHMGTDPKGNGCKYDDIELMLRDAKHIDAGIRFHESGPAHPFMSATTKQTLTGMQEFLQRSRGQ